MKRSGLVYTNDTDFYPLITRRATRIILYSFVWLFGAATIIGLPLLILMMIGKYHPNL
jgi:hypothetical protein